MTDRWQEGWQAGFDEARRRICDGCAKGIPYSATLRGHHDGPVDGGAVRMPCRAWPIVQPETKPACVACEGTGRSSRGSSCAPCHGSGNLLKT